MAREKIKIRKIENLSARQVTFSKRRKGLFKKAQELSVLCDAEVAAVVVSASGKLFDFASSSMDDILESYNLQSKSQPSLNTELADNRGFFGLRRELTEKSLLLRSLRGEDLQVLGIEELQRIEKLLVAGLDRVTWKKNEKVTKHVDEMQQKVMKLTEENEQLRREVVNLSKRAQNKHTASSEIIVFDDMQTLEVPGSSTRHRPDPNISCTTLTLGLACNSAQYSEMDGSLSLQ